MIDSGVLDADGWKKRFNENNTQGHPCHIFMGCGLNIRDTRAAVLGNARLLLLWVCVLVTGTCYPHCLPTK